MKLKLLFIWSTLLIKSLYADGTLDPTFGDGTGYATFPAAHYARGIAIQDNGYIVVVGVGQDSTFQIVRYTTDGDLDLTFNETGIGQTGPLGVPFSVIEQEDGLLVMVGQDASGSNFQLARYTVYGLLDTTFGTNGVVVGPEGFAVDSMLQLNGQIVVTGNDSSGHFLVVRYNSDGSVDTSFYIGPYGFSESIKIQFDGKVITAGTNATGNMQVVRYNTNGTLDVTFGSNGIATGPSGAATSLVIQPNGQYVIGGFDLTTNIDMLLVRFNADGSYDTSFGVGGIVVGPAFFQANAIALQSDGKIVVAGEGTSDIRLARYNSNGTLDTSFGTGGFVIGTIGNVYGLALQENGYIVTVGLDLISDDFEVARYTGSPPLTSASFTSPMTVPFGPVTIAGTAQNPSYVYVYVDESLIDSVATDIGGTNTWTFSTQIPSIGLYTVRALTLYKNGNTASAATNQLRIYGLSFV